MRMSLYSIPVHATPRIASEICRCGDLLLRYDMQICTAHGTGSADINRGPSVCEVKLRVTGVMACYSNEEYCEMVVVYGECGRNATAAAREYALRFPGSSHPTAWTVSNVVRRLRETGSVQSRARSGRPRHQGQHVQPVDVLAFVLANPQCSTRDVSAQCGLSQSRVWQILHQLGAHPFRAVAMHALQPGDAERRFDFCNFVMNMLQIQPTFLSNILWTDEAKFTRCGMFNRHNEHYWGLQNPFWGRQVRHQVRWSVNVWCGIWNTTLIGPVVYEETLTGGRYLELLENVLPVFLEDVPLSELRSMWFQHDGAPPHRPAPVQTFVSNEFRHKVIGYGGSVEWPTRSPDLSPMDFFLWGYLKDHVYHNEPVNLQDLKHRISSACNSVTPQMLVNVHNEALSRIQMCIASDGGLIEHGL